MKFEVPPVQGVPEIVPSLPIENPLGREPDLRLQENGETPPDSCKVAVYAVPPVPPGRDAVVIEGGGTTVSEAVADFVVSATDVAATVTERFAVIVLGAA